MKFKIYSPLPITTTSRLVHMLIETHIAKAAQDVLDTLPDEIERLNKLGCTEIAQQLADFQDTLREATGEPEEPAL